MSLIGVLLLNKMLIRRQNTYTQYTNTFTQTRIPLHILINIAFIKQHWLSTGHILASFRLYFVDTTTEEPTTEAETTTRATTTTPSPTPCVGALNRTEETLGKECGVQGVSGTCIVQHSACMQSLDDTVWRCRCAKGYVRKQQTCVQIPRNIFFSQSSESIEIRAATGPVHTVKHIDLSPLKDFQSSLPDVTLEGRSASSFTSDLYPNNNITLKLKEQLKDGYYEVFISVSVRIDNIDVKEFSLLKVTIVQGQLINSNIILLDGTPIGSIVGHTCVSCISKDDVISVPSDIIDVDKNGNIVTTKHIDLDTMESDTTVAFSSTIMITKNSKLFVNLTVVIVRSHYSVTLDENGQSETIVGLIKGSQLIVKNEDGLRLGGEAIKLGNTILDYEVQTRIDKLLMFSLKWDSQRILDVSVRIYIKDVNDVPPTFSKSSYQFDAIRSEYTSVPVGVVSADDPDSSTLQYSINPSDKLTIDSYGILQVKTQISENDYTANVTVSDARFSKTVPITIKFLEPVDVNLEKKFQGSIPENSAVDVSIVSVFVADYKNFHFTDHGASNYFKINTTQGTISSAKEFDRENEAERIFTYTIVANTLDGGSCSLVVIGEVTITITDVNDEPPVFKDTPYTASVKENSATLLTMTMPIATTDKDENPTVSYSLLDNTDKFSINSITGVITAIRVIDREVDSKITITIQAYDGVHRTNTTIIVTIEDVNDNNPIFIGDPYTFTVDEGSSLESHVGYVYANDTDDGKNALITYDLISKGGYFRINQATGEITVSGDLDREDPRGVTDVHTAIVYARDNGDPIRSATSTLTINIRDVNDNPPVFTPDQGFEDYEENKSCDDAIKRVMATDNDKPNTGNSKITYSILSGAENFTISTTGEIRCKNPLDYEVQKTFTIEVKAEDNGSPQRLSATQTFIVNVKDINDNTPTFIQPKSSLTIRHFTTTEERIIEVFNVEDADSGDNGKLDFAMNGTSTVFLQISKDGILKTKTVNKPDDNTYTAVIVVSDNGIPKLSSTHSININVSSTSTQPVTFKAQEIDMYVMENSNINTLMGTLYSNVLHPPGVSLQFHMIDEDNDPTFSVHLDSSEIRLRRAIDREQKSLHQFVIRAQNRDDSTQSDLALVKVHIQDENDNSPKFDRPKYFFSMNENRTTGSTDVKFQATDADIGENAVIDYNITTAQGCVSYFSLNNDNVLVLDSPIDYDRGERSCVLTVKAFNPNNNMMSSTVNVDVNILDVNDNSPEFLDDDGNNNVKMYRQSIREDATVNTEIPLFGKLRDIDSRENGEIVLQVNPGCWFDVYEEKMKIRLKVKPSTTLDFESGNIAQTCVITATDQGTPSLSTTATLSVNISDVNDNSPVITSPDIHKDIERAASIGEIIVGGIPATDRDSGENGELLYSLRPSQDSPKFFIDPSTGNLTVNSPLYSVQSDEIILTVIVSDKGNPTRSSTAKITITLKDGNPRPYINPATVTVQEHDSSSSNHLIQVSAFERIGGQQMKCDCSFRLDTSRDDLMIENDTGIIRFVNDTYVFDREVDGDTVYVNVIATDNDQMPKDSDPVLIAINIRDINDQNPYFIHKEYNFKVFQKSPDGTQIGTVKAIDKDKDPISLYYINITESSFETGVVSIDQKTGIITKSGNMTLSQSQNSVIKGWVEVQDGKDKSKHPDRALVTITIEFDDKNNHTPEFQKNVYDGGISWDAEIGHSILKVMALDPDPEAAGQVSYSIIAGNDRGFFSVDSEGTLLLAFILDSSIGLRSTEKVLLTIQATDGGIIPKYSSVNATITITGNNPGQCVQGFQHSIQVQSLEDERKSWSAAVYVLVVLLCIAILASLGFLYKWRASAPDDNSEPFEKESKKYKDIDTVGYSELGKRETVEYTHSNETFVPPTQSMAFDAPYTLPKEETHAKYEPRPDYD